MARQRVHRSQHPVLALAGVSLLIGTFGIANATLVAVLERVPEIGFTPFIGCPAAAHRGAVPV